MAKRGKRGRGRSRDTEAPRGAPAPREQTRREQRPPEKAAPAAAPPEPIAAHEPQADAQPAPAAPRPVPRAAEPHRDEPGPGSAGLGGFYRHLHPRLVRRRSATPGATLGLGVATIAALALVTLSGLLLLLYYVPSVERARQSVQDISAIVPFGPFFRNLHRWSGHACVALCALHMLRTLYWGAYRGRHRGVWLVGVGLLLVLLGTSFSGYLLPWDQDAYWTITVGTALASYIPLLGEGLRQALLGGAEVGQVALTRFFALHVLILPALGLALLALHLFRLRRAGGLARPADEDAELVPADPCLLRAELAVALAVTIVLVVLAVFVDARLGPAPDVLRPDDPPKAPWFLVGFQEMVSYSAVVGGFLFPALLFGALAGAPWLDGGAASDGRFLPGRAARAVVSAAAIFCATVAAAAVIWWGDPQQGRPSWINPATLTTGLSVLGALGAWIGRRDRGLAVRTLLAALITALVLFTLIGWYFRGPDWRLIYHPGPGHGAASALEQKP